MTALTILEKRLSCGSRSLKPLVREMGGWLLPAAMGSGAFFYLHGRVPCDPAFDPERMATTDILLALVLVTCLFRTTACSTLETVTRTLTGPFRRRSADRRRASAVSLPRLLPSLRQWLRTPSHNEKDCRPSIFIQISHNPPPAISLPAFG